MTAHEGRVTKTRDLEGLPIGSFIFKLSLEDRKELSNHSWRNGEQIWGTTGDEESS